LRRIFAFLFLALLFSLLDHDDGSTRLLVLDQVAVVTWDKVDEELYVAIRDLPPSVTTLGIGENLGGVAWWSIKIAEILEQRRMTVRIGRECSSACILMILGAPVRIAAEDARFVVHTLHSDEDPLELAESRAFVASWTTERGMSPEFADRYIGHDSGDTRLTAREALAVGILTEVISAEHQ
jgi:hypothetical protein